MKILLSIILAVFAFFAIDIFEKYSNSEYYDKQTETYKKQAKYNEVCKLINNASSLEELNNVEVPKDLEHEYELLKAKLLFQAAEDLILKAHNISKVLNVPMGMHPLVLETISESEKIYDKSRFILDNLSENEDNNYNYQLCLVRGMIYHRYFQFFSSESNAQNFYEQALKHYKDALKYKPKDINAIINIEMLINDNAMLSSKSSSTAKRTTTLRKFGLGKKHGN